KIVTFFIRILNQRSTILDQLLIEMGGTLTQPINEEINICKLRRKNQEVIGLNSLNNQISLLSITNNDAQARATTSNSSNKEVLNSIKIKFLVLIIFLNFLQKFKKKRNYSSRASSRCFNSTCLSGVSSQSSNYDISAGKLGEILKKRGRPKKNPVENLISNDPMEISLTEKMNFFVQRSGSIEQGTGQKSEAAIANQNFINTNAKKKILNLINEKNNKIDEQKKEMNDNFKKMDIFEKKSAELMNKIKDQNKAMDNQYNLIINFIMKKVTNNNRNILSIKSAYHLKDNEKTLLVDASENYLKELIVNIREECFGPGCQFLDDAFINNEALKHIKNTGKFCKFIADILIPIEAQLMLFFPSKRSRRSKNKLLDRTIVKCYNIACKYLGLCIIEEEKTYLEHEIHLVNTRSVDRKTKNANVTYYKMIHKKTFFSLDQITSQENESDTNME
uniref:Uncharacterized protein n=1 Tax=Strongyloides stercoralis TaxID=6248 RepID=A0AAF5DS95_STRER